MRYSVIALLFLWFWLAGELRAQTVNCPPNIDFEQGNFNNWVLYAGTCCPISTAVSGALTNRHTITSGTAIDPYGGFPVVAPGVGVYSLRLGNSNNGNQAERARYYVRIPAGINNYSLIFRYAVVFQDPGHAVADQPRFEVKGYDSATGTPIPCAQFTYVASSALPGFNIAPGSGTTVRYKSWSTASIDLSGYAGKTVAVDFASGDCALGGHFGYGYVDVNCALFQVSTTNCSNAPTTTMTAPPGFFQYEWWNSTFTTLIGTAQVITIPTPPQTTKYALILKPYSGFGCPDTLYTYLKIFSLNTTLSNDTIICKNDTADINISADGSAPPFTYAWAPSIGLTCTNCVNPKAIPAITTDYISTVTDGNGCIKLDTVRVNVDNGPQVTLSNINVSCYGLGNGSIASVVTGGITPYTYHWNTAPVSTTPGISNLTPGIYTVLVSDSIGCKITAADTITQPTLLKDTLIHTNISCFGEGNATATVTVSGGTFPYTYSWNTTPIQTGNMASLLSAGSYIVTTTDANNCTINDTAIITQPAAPLDVIITTHTNVSCNGGTNGVLGISASGGTAPYIYSWNTVPANSSAMISGLSAGIYTVTITDAKGCVKQISDTITQPTMLTATIAKTDVSCFSGSDATASVTVNGGTLPYKYSWNTMPVHTSPAISGLTANTYIVNVTDTQFCTVSASITITQPTLLSTSVSKTDVTCYSGNNGTAIIVPSGGTAPYTYSWNTVPIQTGAAITAQPSGTYIVTTKDLHNCTRKDTVIISQPPVLNVSVSKTDAICFGDNNGSATAVVSGGTAPYTYSWNTSPAQTAQSVTNLSAGNYVVTIKDNELCQVSAPVTINQPSQLTVAASHTDASCFGYTDGDASVSVSGGIAPYAYSWNTTPVQTTSLISNLPAGAYTATVKDNHQCIATTTVTIAQPVALNIVGTKTNTTCFGGNNGTALVSSSGGTLPHTYSWNTNPVQTTPFVNNLSIGTYTVTITDAKGCSLNDVITIGQPALLTAITSVTNVSCYLDENATATVSASGGTPPYTYLWNTPTPQTTTTATGLNASKYTVQITDAKGCKLSVTTDSVRQPDEIIIIASQFEKTCPFTAHAKGSIDTIYGGVPPYKWLWNTSPPQYTDTVYNLQAGTYSITVTDENGCNKSANLIIDNYPKPEVNAGDDVVICPGKSVVLTATGASTYAWSPSAGLSCTTCASPIAMPEYTSVYQVIGIDINHCSDTDEVVVAIAERQGGEVGPGLKICRGDTVQLYAGGGISYLWAPGTGMNNNTLANPKAAVDANTIFTVLVKENECFTDTLFQQVEVYERPTVDLGPDLSGIPGATLLLHAAVTNANSINWTPATGLSCTGCYDPVASLLKTITYTAIVSNDSICFAEDDITIRVSCDGSFLFIPNTFTPNGDGINDYFYASAHGLNVISLMRVYNRWGEIMFEAKDIPPGIETKGWNGQYKNAPLSPDVYVYYFEVSCANGEKIFLKGDISIIR